MNLVHTKYCCQAKARAFSAHIRDLERGSIPEKDVDELLSVRAARCTRVLIHRSSNLIMRIKYK